MQKFPKIFYKTIFAKKWSLKYWYNDLLWLGQFHRTLSAQKPSSKNHCIQNSWGIPQEIKLKLHVRTCNLSNDNFKIRLYDFLIFIIWFTGRLLLIMLILCITLKATYPKVLCGLNLRRRIFFNQLFLTVFFFLLFFFGSLISNRFDHIGLRITSTASFLKRFNN